MNIRILTRGKSGKKPDGRTVVVTDETINEMVSMYCSERHEAPLCIGDPKDSSPAYGWVRELYKMGDGLYARSHQLHSRFIEGLRNGIHEVQRVTFYPDYMLRRVCFTGPQYENIGLPGIFEDSGPMFCFDCLEEKASHQGGETKMVDNNDPRVKAFLELGNELFFPGKKDAPKTAAEKLNNIAKEILINPPKYDESGRMYWGEFNYSRAFELACLRNPDLATEYYNEIEEVKARNTNETYLSRFGGGKK